MLVVVTKVVAARATSAPFVSAIATDLFTASRLGTSRNAKSAESFLAYLAGRAEGRSFFVVAAGADSFSARLTRRGHALTAATRVAVSTLGGSLTRRTEEGLARPTLLHLAAGIASCNPTAYVRRKNRKGRYEYVALISK